jgi:hypothetical protein
MTCRYRKISSSLNKERDWTGMSSLRDFLATRDKSRRDDTLLTVCFSLRHGRHERHESAIGKFLRDFAPFAVKNLNCDFCDWYNV